MVYSVDNSEDYKIPTGSFLWTCVDFSKNSIYFMLATRWSTSIQTKKCSYNWMKSSKSIPNGTSSSTESSHYHKTKLFVSWIERSFREQFLWGKFLEYDLAQNFIIDTVRMVHSLLEFLDLFLIWLERFTNYFLINWLILINSQLEGPTFYICLY